LLDSSANSTDYNSVQYQLYQLPGSDFNDIATGSNGADSAAIGYDLVTGLGTPKVANLVNDLTAITWTGGGGDSHWGKAANWSDDIVPDQYDNVIIPSNASVSIGSGSYTVNDLSIGTGATLTISGALTGTVQDNGTLVFNCGTANTTFGSQISGTGTVVQQGSGTLAHGGQHLLRRHDHFRRNRANRPQ
jgi:hypothetical protein